MAAKRKRTDLSLSDKYKVIQFLDQKLSQSDISKQVGCSQSQVSRISSKKDEIRSLYESNGDPKRKRQRAGKAPDVEGALLEWFKNARDRGIPISGPILIEKAKDLAKQLGIADFNPSSGWLSRWKERNAIVYKKLHGEIQDADTVSAVHWVANVLPEFLQPTRSAENIDPDDDYNSDDDYPVTSNEARSAILTLRSFFEQNGCTDFANIYRVEDDIEATLCLLLKQTKITEFINWIP